MERLFFTINESVARTANDINSMSSYEAGSATAEYQSKVNQVYDYVDKIAEKKPHLLEKAQRMAERYSRKLAEYYNAYYRNEASCPSILICGGGNFPVKKKNKQNSRRESLMNDWNYLEEYATKIKHLLTMQQPILSSDAQAIELLEDKLESLKENQEMMKAVNKAIRMKDTEKGDEELLDMGYTDEQIKKFREPDFCGRIGFPSYALQNNNANIKRVEGRLNQLKAAKEAGTKESENRFFRVVENTEIMRLQIFFEDKPEAEVRDILKSNGFKWAPSQSAWQRQLTTNAKYALSRITKRLEEMENAKSVTA
jgi:hypothetical protein